MLVEESPEVQMMLPTSYYYKIYRASFYQGFRLYIDGYWQEAYNQF